jgi:hypothetical protein
MPAVAIAETPGGLVTKWNELNLLCRGGPRDDPKADEACERRSVVEALLKKHGCRFVIYTKGPLHEEWDLQTQKENEMRKTIFAIAAAVLVPASAYAKDSSDPALALGDSPWFREVLRPGL